MPSHDLSVEAVHVAGHAALLHELGGELSAIQLSDQGDEKDHQGLSFCLSGLSLAEIVSNRAEYVSNVENRILIALAGPAAELLFAGRIDNGSINDFSDAFEALKIIQAEATMDDLHPALYDAQRVLATEHSWSRLFALAEGLQQKRWLTSAEVRAILRRDNYLHWTPPFPPVLIRQ